MTQRSRPEARSAGRWRQYACPKVLESLQEGAKDRRSVARWSSPLNRPFTDGGCLIVHDVVRTTPVGNVIGATVGLPAGIRRGIASGRGRSWHVGRRVGPGVAHEGHAPSQSNRPVPEGFPGIECEGKHKWGCSASGLFRGCAARLQRRGAWGFLAPPFDFAQDGAQNDIEERVMPACRSGSHGGGNRQGNGDGNQRPRGG